MAHLSGEQLLELLDEDTARLVMRNAMLSELRDVGVDAGIATAASHVVRQSLVAYLRAQADTRGIPTSNGLIWEEVERIRTAVRKGEHRPHPEEDVRFLLGLVYELTFA